MTEQLDQADAGTGQPDVSTPEPVPSPAFRPRSARRRRGRRYVAGQVVQPEMVKAVRALLGRCYTPKEVAHELQVSLAVVRRIERLEMDSIAADRVALGHRLRRLSLDAFNRARELLRSPRTTAYQAAGVGHIAADHAARLLGQPTAIVEHVTRPDAAKMRAWITSKVAASQADQPNRPALPPARNGGESCAIDGAPGCQAADGGPAK